MKILWISSLAWKFDSGYMYELQKSGAVSGSFFQQSIIEGLESNKGVEVDILCEYPSSNCVKKTFFWSHSSGSNDICIGGGYSRLFKVYKLIKEIKKIKEKKYDLVCVYLIHTPYLAGMSYAKYKFKGSKSLLIVPDLPQYMDMSLSNKKIKRILKKLDYLLIKRLIKNVDGNILFSEAMKESKFIEEEQFIVLEGVYSPQGLELTTLPTHDQYIVYAGTLHYNIGIEELIAAMNFVNKDIKLKIFGDGDYSFEIKKIAKTNPRIEYLGFIEREKLFEYEKQALAIVNTRNPEDEYTKYSFPSKLFECLASGAPVISTKLEGIPNEYYNYLYTIEDYSVESIARKINEVSLIKNDERRVRGEEAIRFIKEEKNKEIQGLKVYEFIKSLCR